MKGEVTHDVTTPLLPYGVGIDTHKEFIQVCCLVNIKGQTHRYEAEFATSWSQLRAAKQWITDIVSTADGLFDLRGLRYTIESTGCYHIPVLIALGGSPAVVNPVLAGHTRRKTDVLDARLLAHHSLIGFWPTSFIPTEEAQQLRCLLGMRNEAVRFSTRCTNRINNHLLRFGHTLGKEHSMADTTARAIVEDLLEGRKPISDLVCEGGIPDEVKCIFKDSYGFYDQFKGIAKSYHKAALKFIQSHTWPIKNGEVAGDKLLKALMSVPGVGEVSALTWLSVVCDPKRFQVPNQVAAFCGADPSLKVSAGKVTSHIKRKGNARLHHVLKNVSAQLVRRHDDPLGQWGYALMRRHAKGGWGRAINAVSRRLSIMLWHVHSFCVEFSYEQYQFMIVPAVDDMPVEDMDIHQRYKKMLKDAGLDRSGDVAKAFLTTLPQQKGIGAGCLKTVKQWMDNHRVEPSSKNRRESSSVASFEDVAVTSSGNPTPPPPTKERKK